MSIHQYRPQRGYFFFTRYDPDRNSDIVTATWTLLFDTNNLFERVIVVAINDQLDTSNGSYFQIICIIDNFT